MRPLLIVDGDNLAHRAFHSTPGSARSPEGRPINAITGFFSMLGRICREEKPRGVFVAWDTLGVDTYRSKLWPAYQGGRYFDPELVEQLNKLPELCLAAGMGVGKEGGYEADDLAGSAAQLEQAQGGQALLLTADRDWYQLVTPSITVISPQRGTQTLARIGPAEVVAHYGVLPEQVPDFKALSGDASDGIPGIAGIGPKSAARLLLQHGTLGQAVADWEPEKAAKALVFQKVATIRTDAAVELPATPVGWATLADRMDLLGAGGLAGRLRLLGESPHQTS